MLALRPSGNGGAPSIVTVAQPQVLTSYVLVRVIAAAIQPSDILNATGSFGGSSYTLGRDYAGIVEDGPPEHIGEEVYGTSGKELSFQTDGTQAEYCLIPIDCLSSKPKRLSFVQAAAVGVPYTTAMLALRRAAAKAGDIVLVVGSSGAVGSAVCQLARYIGCRVLQAARHGSAEVNLVSDPGMEAVHTETAGKGANVAIDTTGSSDLIRAALKVLATDGRLSFISAPRNGSTALTFDLKDLYREQKSIIGCNSVQSEQAETAKELQGMFDGFEDGSLVTPSDTDFEQVSMREAVAAYDLMMRVGTRKKYVVVP